MGRPSEKNWEDDSFKRKKDPQGSAMNLNSNKIERGVMEWISINAIYAATSMILQAGIRIMESNQEQNFLIFPKIGSVPPAGPTRTSSKRFDGSNS
jgi:hypothetical protein